MQKDYVLITIQPCLQESSPLNTAGKNPHQGGDKLVALPGDQSVQRLLRVGEVADVHRPHRLDVLVDPRLLPAAGPDRRQDLDGEWHRAHPHAVVPPGQVRAGHHDGDDGQPRLQRGVHEPLLEGQQSAVLGSCALREQDEGQVVLDHCTGDLFHGVDCSGRVGAVDAQVVSQHVELPEQRVPDDLCDRQAGRQLGTSFQRGRVLLFSDTLAAFVCVCCVLTSFLAIPTVPVGASHMTRKMSSGDAWLQMKIPLVFRCSAPSTLIGFPRIHSSMRPVTWP